MDAHHYPAQSPLGVGLRGRCPRCGEGKIFDGFLSIKKTCRACRLDLAFTDSGDGPAIFIILFVGFIVGALFLYVELAYQPAYWVHAVLWLPTIIILSLGFLRPFKGVMIALQYKNNAHEGLLDGSENEDG